MQMFMESHVFAVWDFMSLLKALQRGLTEVSVPWTPKGDGATRAFINEIVAGEESDVTEDGRYLSHLEMYLEAMDECGADTQVFRSFMDKVREGRTPSKLSRPAIPPAARAFDDTMEMVQRGDLAEIASAFTLARGGDPRDVQSPHPARGS